MFCPKCTSYLIEDDIIKRDTKYIPDGGVIVEYTAFCPRCEAEMGKMSWGQFTVNSDLTINLDPLEGVSLVGKSDFPVQEDSPHFEFRDAGVKHCPHCGLPLPKV